MAWFGWLINKEVYLSQSAGWESKVKALTDLLPWPGSSYMYGIHDLLVGLHHLPMNLVEGNSGLVAAAGDRSKAAVM